MKAFFYEAVGMDFFVKFQHNKVITHDLLAMTPNPSKGVSSPQQ